MLGEDSFFYNINSSFADVELGRLVYINVEAQTKIPQFAGVGEAGIIQDTFNSILNAMKTANNSDLLVVRIQSWSRSPIITSISGILLGYPVIYTFGMNAAIPTAENMSNCLADCSLEVYKVFGSVSQKVQRNLGLTNMDHLIMSFSIPSHLLNDDDSPDYVALLESRFSCQNSDLGLFTRISVERSSTILPCVVV
ncbi:hypothetical protein BDR26DRAFT_857576 [Obelidium mucronatum]|nr:hypothetical protein BDR26DRAFT_857576 [Obelidium mucronatum]